MSIHIQKLKARLKKQQYWLKDSLKDPLHMVSDFTLNNNSHNNNSQNIHNTYNWSAKSSRKYNFANLSKKIKQNKQSKQIYTSTNRPCQLTATKKLSHKPNILFFDSGCGGISILRVVEQLFGDMFVYNYYFDNALFPYSEKADSLLIDKLVKTLKLRVKQLKVDCLVIACNTASTLILDQLRAVLNIPVIGVIPAVKPAVEKLVALGRTDEYVGVVATKATVKRAYLHKLIKDFGAVIDYKIKLLGSTEFVQLAENHLKGKDYLLLTEQQRTLPKSQQKILIKSKRQKKLQEIFAQWLYPEPINTIFEGKIESSEENKYKLKAGEKIGALVLACTHFPLLINDLKELFPNSKLIDSGFAIARRIGIIFGVFKNQEIDLQRQEFISYMNYNPKLRGKVPKRLFATKKITKQDFKALKAEGFFSFKVLPHK